MGRKSDAQTSTSWVAGIHAVEAILKSDAGNIQRLLVAAGRQDKRLTALTELARNQGVQMETVQKQVLAEYCGHHRHQSVLAEYLGVAPRTEGQLLTDLAAREQPWLVLVLDEIQDPHNLGACLRSADAAAVDAVVVSKDNAADVTPVVQKVAAGAAATVPVYRVTNLVRVLEQLKEAGVWLYGAAGESRKSLYDVDFKGSSAIVLGSEGSGLRSRTSATCDETYQIPMLGTVESLNVSVACGISLFEVRRQRHHGD